MRTLAAAVAILALAGCSAFRRDLPPWARPVPASASPAATPPAEEPGVAPPTSSAMTTPESPAPSSLPPVVAPPPPPSVAPARPPSPPPTAPVAAPPPPTAPPATPQASQSLPLTASLPPAEMRRLQDEAQRAIDETERLLRQLDGRPLVPKDLETLRLAQGLVEQAKKALGGQEYERAANLAAKARTLADDLSTHR